MLEDEVTTTFLSQFSDLFPQLRLRHWERGLSLSEGHADMLLRIAVGNNSIEKLLVAEVKSQGHPQRLQNAAYAARASASLVPGAYAVVVVPYVSPQGQAFCRQTGINFMDLSGNCRLDLNDIYIEVSNRPSRYKSTRHSVKLLFRGKSTRVLRVLLVHPKQRWTMRNLAQEARVSVGYVSKISRRLDELALIERGDRGGLRVTDPGRLLDLWRECYRYTDNKTVGLYGLSNADDIVRQITRLSGQIGARYALTLFSGADLVAPFTRHSKEALYFSGNVENLRNTLGLKPVPSGEKVLVLIPYDEGVFYGLQTIQGQQVVSNVQLYLDLYSYAGRGQEQAEFLRDRAIRF